jgi:beta-glucuronidase
MEEPGTLITHVYGRTRSPLNGKWHVLIDPYEAGYYDIFGNPSRGGYFRNRRAADAGELVEYRFDTAELLDVPGDWNSQKAELLLYEGTVWYQRDFHVEVVPGRRLFLCFDGANYETRVWVNGEPAGEHEGGFTPFHLEITSLVRDGSNFVICKVDNRRRRGAVPTLQTDWWNYGGLTRDVQLVDVPASFLREYAIWLDRAQSQIRGWFRIDGEETRQRVRVAVPEAGLQCEVESDESGLAEFQLPADVERWSPEHPKRYAVVLESDTDRVEERIGFRTIETSGEDLLLNGESIRLRGISIHEEAPLRDGRAHGEEDARVLLGWAKELGCNFVRLAHYPHNEHQVRMADELGLLVWSEIPVYWNIDWENPKTLPCARSQLREMIARDRNRASVILWSVANETPPTPERQAFLRTLVETARTDDPTRLVAAALFPGFDEINRLSDFVTARAAGNDAAPPTVELSDPLGEDLDVIGRNDYTTWYMPAFVARKTGLAEREVRAILLEALASFEWKSRFGKPLVISEFGADALQGRRGDDLDVFTEDCQANLYRHQAAVVEKIPFLRGFSPWILQDFRSPRRPLPEIQDFYNRKGLVSNRGIRKAAFSVLREFYERWGR